MPQFGKSSATRLSTCHPLLQELFNEVIKHRDCTILQGNRPKEEQNEYFRTGKSKVKYPNSKHNAMPSLAVDVAPYFSKAPHIRWDDSIAFYHFMGFVLGIAAKLGINVRWGGNWDSDDELNDQTFMDLVHLEIIE